MGVLLFFMAINGFHCFLCFMGFGIGLFVFLIFFMQPKSEGLFHMYVNDTSLVPWSTNVTCKSTTTFSSSSFLIIVSRSTRVVSSLFWSMVMGRVIGM